MKRVVCGLLMAACLAPAPAVAKKHRWSLSTEVAKFSVGWSAIGNGVAVEYAAWDHLGLRGLLNANVASSGYAKEFAGVSTLWDSLLEARWRPAGRGLQGFYLGLGGEKTFYAENRWYLGTPNVQSGNGLSGFYVDQGFRLFAEAGNQWIRPSGLLCGVKLLVPCYNDRLYGVRDPWEDSTLSFDMGFAW